MFLSQNPISWTSCKQKAVSRSSNEAEYRALANASAEVRWIQLFFGDIGFPLRPQPRILCDNTGAIHLSLHPVQHTRMKHISVDLHFVRDLVGKGFLAASYVNTLDQISV